MEDPELHIRGHPDSKIRGAGLKDNFFTPFRLHFGLKIRGAPPLDLVITLSALSISPVACRRRLYQAR